MILLNSFIRNDISVPRVGDKIKNIKFSNGRNLYSYFESQRTLVCAWSISCIPCLEAMNVINDLITCDGLNSVTAFVSCDDESLEIIREGFLNKISLFKMEVDDMYFLLGIPAVPWAMVVEKNGQILTSGTASNKLKILEVISPMRTIG